MAALEDLLKVALTKVERLKRRGLQVPRQRPRRRITSGRPRPRRPPSLALAALGVEKDPGGDAHCRLSNVLAALRLTGDVIVTSRESNRAPSSTLGY